MSAEAANDNRIWIGIDTGETFKGGYHVEVSVPVRGGMSVGLSAGGTQLRFYLLKRFLEAVPVLFAIIVFNFVLIHLAPGSPVNILAGEMADPAYMAELTHELGLDQPLYTQLFLYLVRMMQGNFGYSFIFRKPVFELIMSRMPATLLLMVSVVVISSLVGVVLGVVSAVRVHSLVDNVTSIASLIGYAMPVFWSGELLLLFFALYIPLFPAGGMESLSVQYTGLAFYLDVLRHAVLPIANLSLLNLALIFRLTRSELIETLTEDYVITARAKGLDERVVVWKHALRNGLLPVVTVIGANFGVMVGGAVLTETIFAWPGVGRLMYESIFNRDYPVLMGIFTIVAVMVIVTNLITDIVYGLLDPRIRYH